MAQPFPLQTTFTGMVQDGPRDALPPGACWNMVDFIPIIIGAPLRKRGGWTDASPALGSATSVGGVMYAPFSGGAKNLAITNEPKLYTFVDASTSTLIGSTSSTVSQNPVFHNNLAVIPFAGGATAPQKYDGTTLATLSATAPNGTYALVYKDRTALLRTSGNRNRAYFSPTSADGGPAGTWNTGASGSWLDTSGDITGGVALRNSVLIFHLKTSERIRGATPPPNGDFILEPAFAVGCIDARSIIPYNEFIIWADAQGVYQSDGAALADLTKLGGIRTYWRSLFSPSTTYTVSAGLLRDMYIISINNGSTKIDTLVCDLQRRAWFRVANFPGLCFGVTGDSSEELWMGRTNAGKVAKLSSILTASSTYKNDGDGTAVTPLLETPFYRGWMRVRRRWFPSPGLQTWKWIFSTLDIRDSASDLPTLTLAYVTDPSSTSYTNLTPAISATTAYTRVKRPLRFPSNGVAFKITQANASADTRIYGVECDMEARESSRLAQ